MTPGLGGAGGRSGFLGNGRIESVRTPGRPPALLAFHGFGSTPNEVLPLAELAARRGLRFVAPLLPGHGSHPRELAKTRYVDWYEAAEDEFIALADAGPVIVAGQSMGAVLALELAISHPKTVKAAVALANATRLMSPYPTWALAAAVRVGVPDFLIRKSNGPDISTEALKADHLTYESQPVYAANSLRVAGARVRRALGGVFCPTFIAHGLHDHVCPVANAWEAADRLGTREVEVHLLPRSCHILTKDQDRDLLLQRLGAFLDRVL